MSELERISKEIINYLGNLDGEQWRVAVNSERDVRGLVAHLAGWKFEATKAFEKYVNEGIKPWFYGVKDHTETNKKMDKLYENLSNKETLQLLIDSYDERKKFVEKYGDKKLREAGLDWMFEDNSESHALEHFKQIKRALNE